MKFVLTSMLGNSHVDAAALLDMHKMLVVEKETLSILLGDKVKLETLLDIGAGNGVQTLEIAPLFQHVTATEASLNCFNRLEESEFIHSAVHAGDLDSFESCGSHFDVVTLFNVLDRCKYPVTLLRQAMRCLHAEGRLVIAMVHPFSPFVVQGEQRGFPVERLPLTGCRSMEEQCLAAVQHVFRPLGLHLECLARLPYLCVANDNSPFPITTMDCAVMVLTPGGTRPPPPRC